MASGERLSLLLEGGAGEREERRMEDGAAADLGMVVDLFLEVQSKSE